MAGEKVLIVEDDAAMLRALKDNFQAQGYVVATASDGDAGLRLAVDDKPDLMILDVMLPGVNGYEICRILRSESLEMPVIMVTAKSDESDLLLGLNLGADDYVTKPFSVRELMARAGAVLRRREQGNLQRVLFGDFEFDIPGRRLLRKGQDVPLSPKEFNLLAYLAKQPGRPRSRNEILKAVWGYDVFVTQRSVDRCVNTLRQKIESDPTDPVYLKTVREVGYRFEGVE